MTSRDRVLRAIAHEATDVLPGTLYLDDRLRKALETSRGVGEVCLDYPDDTVRILWETETEIIDETCYRDRFGVLYVRSEGGVMFVDAPLKEPDAALLPGIKLLPDGEEQRIRAARRDNPDKFIYYQFSMTFGERLWAMRGLERYLTDVAEYPRFIHEALDVLLEMHFEALETLLDLNQA